MYISPEFDARGAGVRESTFVGDGMEAVMQVSLVADSRCSCGEGPLWHPEERRLYFVDIDAGALLRYDPATGTYERLFDGEALGGFTIQEDGSLLLFLARGAIRRWCHGEFTTLVEEIPDERETRFNDVAADPQGRVFCGTMPAPSRPGRLYRLDRDGTLSIVLEGIGCSNGIGFSRDLKTMYYTDSAAGEIYTFRYDADTGALTDQKVFVRIPKDHGSPDGLTVDAEGYIWSAIWNGSRVIRFAPDGVEERRIAVPCKKASSVIFAGEDYGDLYITTAARAGGPEEGFGAGGLFHVRPGVRGRAEFRSRIRID